MEKVFGASKTKNLIFAVAFIVIWGGFTLLNYLVPSQDFSEAENRALAQFPNYTTPRLLDGHFMNDMDTYLNDQFVGRPYWVAGQSLIEFGLGKREINGVYISSNDQLRHYPPGNDLISTANVQGINAFAAKYGMPTTVMLVPSSTYTLRGSLPYTATEWDEGAFIQTVYSGLSGAVHTVDAAGALAAENSQYIYYRTDHHWTTYGASLAYRALAQTLGLPDRTAELDVTPLSTDFSGTTQARSGFPLTEPDVMEQYQTGLVLRYETYGIEGDAYETRAYDSIYFPEYLEQKDKYTYFLGPLKPYVTIYTGANTGKKLLIFKDSYAHCLTPMLLADYDEIRLVDLRSVKAEDIGEFVDAARYDEALFLYSADTFSQQLGPGLLAE